MNKTLTISLIAALGIAGGGAYVLMDSDKSFADYVPDSVSSIVGDYIPGFTKSETMTISATDTMDVVAPQMQEAPLSQIPSQEAMQELTQETSQQIEPQVEPVVEQQLMEKNDDNAVEIAMDEIQKSLNEIAEIAPVTTSKNPKAVKIGKKIEDATSKLTKIDLENKELEEKFQNILRKNRELAKKLQAIDKQIADAS